MVVSTMTIIPSELLNTLIKLNINNQGKNSCSFYCIFHLITLYKVAVSFLLTVMLPCLLIVHLFMPQGKKKIRIMCFFRFSISEIHNLENYVAETLRDLQLMSVSFFFNFCFFLFS